MSRQVDPLPRWAERLRWTRPETGGIFLLVDLSLSGTLAVLLLTLGLLYATHNAVLTGCLLLGLAAACAVLLGVGAFVESHYAEIDPDEEDDRP